MRLPKDLLSQTYVKPRMFLCETDKSRICQLETIDMQGLFKFNSFSELTFTVGRTYIDTSSHVMKVNPYYNKIEALRLIELENFGYFEIQDPEIVSDGIQEVKNITAYSLEYSLSQKYLEDFNINTGENNSVEVIYGKDKNSDGVLKPDEIDSIVFYNPTAFTEYDQKHSLLHLILEKTYGWKIGHVDASLRTMTRKFEISRATVYDFIMQDICDKFNCFVVFDTTATDSDNNKINTINFYAESPVAKFQGDGTTNIFNVTPVFDSIDTVTIDSYKTTKYTYNNVTGVLILEDAPSNGANIEVKDGSQKKYSTDIYVTFDNLAQEVNISYSADDIKTVLTVKGADDLDIREVNMGLPYITDFSYYYSVDWMGKDLYEAYGEYLKKYNDSQDSYTANAQEMLEFNGYIDFEEYRLSLQYSIAEYVDSKTVGTYYVRGGNTILTAEQKEIARTMKAEFNQTSIDLTARPRVSWEKMHEAGWYTEQGSYSTLDTVTFLSSDFDIIDNNGNDYAINFTPILPNGYVISGGHDGLWDYINKQLQNGVSFQHMNDIFIGIYSSLEDAEVAAERLHILQEQFYQYGFPITNYYYKEVKLPSEYSTEVEHYYTLSGNDLNEKKVSALYEALKEYYTSGEEKTVTKIDELSEDFAFMEEYTIANLSADLKLADDTENKDTAVRKFLDLMWNQIGRTPLKSLYQEPYKTIKETNTEDGWNEVSNDNYWRYYPVTVLLGSIELAISVRNKKIEEYEQKRDLVQKANDNISTSLNLVNNFTPKQLIRLNSFWREDEYVDDNFIETESDSIESLMRTKQELLECGRIELSKLCEPKLEFSMSMANIYALPEFEPIVDQFQLGNLINIEIRPKTETEKAYVKRSRLLEVSINFDDFSDFSCEFGELTGIKTPSSIHADLLAQAMSAGKSVASSASYWDKGADLATETDLKIQQGLIGAINGLYNSDQSVTIDDDGILLRKVNEDGSFSPYQAWLTNNTILLSSNGFKEGTAPRTGLGEFTVDGQTFYGILAEAVLSGYIEGSRIVGGTIDIGDGTFVVNSDGSVVMKASSIDGYVEENNVISSINQSSEKIAINANKISLAGKEIDLTSDDISITSTNFSVTKEGKITATSGEIAGWKIYESLLRKEITVNDVDYQMYLQAADGTTTSNAFAVRKKGPDDTDWDVQFAVNYAGKLTAKNANITGTITAKDGSIAGYNIGKGGSYANSIYKRVSSDNADYEVGLNASSEKTDLAFYVKESTDNWSSSYDTFYVRNDGKLYAKNVDVTGKIAASSGSIGSWTIGDLGGYTDSIYSTFCAASTPSSSNPEYAVFMRGKGSSASTIAMAVKKRTSSSTDWSDAEETFYVLKNGHTKMTDADVTGNINAASGSISGDLNISGSLVNTQGDYTVTLRGVQSDAGKGVFYITDNSSGSAEYPVRINGDGSARFTNVTITGDSTIASACIPNLSANKITSGTLDPLVLDASVITTGNFSSKSLSTGNLTVTNGAKIGSWSITSTGSLYAVSGDVGVGLSAYGLSAGSGGSTSWVSILMAGQNASDKRLKKNIFEFDNKLDNIFDSLRPVQFEYSTDTLSHGIHFGYLAQDVIKSFEDEGKNIKDYSFVYETATENDSTEKYYQLNKAEFIALNTWQIQKLKSRIEELEKKIETLES